MVPFVWFFIGKFTKLAVIAANQQNERDRRLNRNRCIPVMVASIWLNRIGKPTPALSCWLRHVRYIKKGKEHIYPFIFCNAWKYVDAFLLECGMQRYNNNTSHIKGHLSKDRLHSASGRYLCGVVVGFVALIWRAKKDMVGVGPQSCPLNSEARALMRKYR